MAPRSEHFSLFSAYGAALSTLSANIDDFQVEENLSAQDANLFNRNGRYSVIHEIAPHLSMDMRHRLFSAFREKVSDTLKQKFEEKSAADYDAASFDPLLIRKWISFAPMVHETPWSNESQEGLCGVGAGFSWSEEQKDFLGDLWEEFNSLISMEAGTNAERRFAPPKQVGFTPFSFNFADVSCQPCDPNTTQISSKLGQRLDAVEKTLKGEHNVTEGMTAKIEAILNRKQHFLKGPALEKFRSEFFDETTESGLKNTNQLVKLFNDKAADKEADAKAADKENTQEMDVQSMQERVFKDLVRLNDHFYILLPDLCRQLCDAQTGGPFSNKVRIMDRVAPHVSKQYRAEQTDLSLLENIRRMRFERDALATQLVDEILSGGAEAMGGMKLAKCPPGCVC